MACPLAILLGCISVDTCKLVIGRFALLMLCTMWSHGVKTHSDTQTRDRPRQHDPVTSQFAFTGLTCLRSKHRHTLLKMTKHESIMTHADSNPSKCLLSSCQNIQAPSSSKMNSVKSKPTHIDL